MVKEVTWKGHRPLTSTVVNPLVVLCRERFALRLVSVSSLTLHFKRSPHELPTFCLIAATTRPAWFLPGIFPIVTPIHKSSRTIARRVNSQFHKNVPESCSVESLEYSNLRVESERLYRVEWLPALRPVEAIASMEASTEWNLSSPFAQWWEFLVLRKKGQNITEHEDGARQDQTWEGNRVKDASSTRARTSFPQLIKLLTLSQAWNSSR